MKEFLRPDQIEAAKAVSRSFEESWRAFSHPQRHSSEEIEQAKVVILGKKRNYLTAINSQTYPLKMEILDMIYAGLFHHGIIPPPEVKYSAPQN